MGVVGLVVRRFCDDKSKDTSLVFLCPIDEMATKVTSVIYGAIDLCIEKRLHVPLELPAIPN